MEDWSTYGGYADGGNLGDVGGFVVTHDDEGNLLGSSAGPAITYVPQATNAGASYGDAFKVLESVTTGLQSIAKTYLGFQSQVASFKTAQSNISLARDQALAGNAIAQLNNASAFDLAKIKTAGAVDIAKYNAATQSLMAQRQLTGAAMPTLGQLFYPASVNPATGQTSINPLFILVLAGGAYLAYRSTKK